MIIFDNAFLEKLKDAIVKSNINKSLIANLKDISSSSSNPDSNKNKNSNSINNTDSFSSNLDALSSNNNDIEQFYSMCSTLLLCYNYLIFPFN